MYNVCYIYNDSECTDLVLKGYAFLRNFKPVGEFLYYKDEKLLEIYDLEEEVTNFYVNVTICEIKDILEDCFYWGCK